MHFGKKVVTAFVTAALALTMVTPAFAAPQSDADKTKQELAQTNAKLKEIQTQLDKANEELTINKALLPQKQAEYEKLVDKMGTRSRAMYMMGTDSYLEYVFSAKSFSQMLANAKNLTYVVSSDRNLVNQAQKAKDDIENSTKSIEDNAKNLQKQKDELSKIQEKQSKELSKQQAQQVAQQVAKLKQSASTAGSYSASSDVTNIAASNSPKLQKAMQIMQNLCNDNSHGYSQSNRWGPDFDCASSIIYSLRMAGFNTGVANSTRDITAGLCANGWVKVPSSSAQAGDILWTSGHVAFYMGGGVTAEFHSSRGNPQSGDQTGTEADVKKSWKPVSAYSYAIRYAGN